VEKRRERERERERERRKRGRIPVCSNESIDKFGVSPDAMAALSSAVTFHVKRSLSFPIRLSASPKDEDGFSVTLRSLASAVETNNKKE
jgi:hypothetical protein